MHTLTVNWGVLLYGVDDADVVAADAMPAAASAPTATTRHILAPLHHQDPLPMRTTGSSRLTAEHGTTLIELTDPPCEQQDLHRSYEIDGVPVKNQPTL